MIKQNIAKLLDTEMERKDFLKLIGVGAIAAIGITQIIKAVSQPTLPKTTQKTANGYGALAYGGNPKETQ